MKYWEFLIQKEGDQTWLPLETQQVEILEGRYRVVAHTDRANTSVEVQVSQLVTDEMPPRRRVRRRVSTTNGSGLIVVMPFVNLQPGQWDLKCSSLEGAYGDPWQYAVQLQVFAHTEEDWSGEWPVPSDDETRSSVASVILEGDREVALELVNQDLPLIQAQAELEANSSSVPQKVATAPSYQVALKQQAYLAHPKLPMKIEGNVSALSELTPRDAESRDAESGAIAQGTSQLWIRLQNPETARVIMEASRPLSLARLPADFKVQIQLPAEVTTRVILGEVSLRTESSETSADGGEILAAKSFTISAGIADLLEAIANQETDSFSGNFEEEVVSMPSLSPINKTIAPAVGVVLPPKLDPLDYSPIAESAIDRNGHAQPSLPDFAKADVAFNPVVEDAPVEFAQPVQPEELLSESPVSDLSTSDVSASDLPVLDPHIAETLASETLASETSSISESLEPDLYTPEPYVSDPHVSDLHVSEMSAPTPSLEGSSLDHSSVPVDRPPADFPPADLPPMVAQPAQFLGTSVEDSDIEADEIAAMLEDIDKNLSSDESDLDALEAPGIEAALPKVPTPISHEHSLTDEQAKKLAANEAARRANRRSPNSREKSPRQVEASLDFQSLRLKDHFWNRLSNLTHQSHQEAAQLAERMKEAGVSNERPNLLKNLDSRANSEVVIYGDDVQPSTKIAEYGASEPDSQSSVSAQPSTQSSTSSLTTASPLVERLLNSRRSAARPTTAASPAHAVSDASVDDASISNSSVRISAEDLPEMALPVISVPMGDLVAGDIITVTVRTRPSVYKPFIKLWMVDRQSRSLVIEPKLLTNMTPDALGDLEASTQLHIPMHCLDVQIAAIAIDMATQQESAKAIVNRHVVPPDQSSPLKDANQ